MNTQVDAPPAAPSRDYSAFDAELTHKALNVNMFVRLLAWLKPYRFTLSISIVLTLASAAIAVLQPIVNGRRNRHNLATRSSIQRTAGLWHG